MNLETWILILALFIMAVFQLKERKFTSKSVAIPIIVVGYFSYQYINSVPTNGINGIILLSITLVGVLFGVLSFLSSDVYIKNGAKFVKCKFPYLILWVVSLGIKIISAEYMTKWNISGTVHFILKHHINPNIISTSFMFFTIAMIAVRLICIFIKFQLINNRANEVLQH